MDNFELSSPLREFIKVFGLGRILGLGQLSSPTEGIHKVIWVGPVLALGQLASPPRGSPSTFAFPNGCNAEEKPDGGQYLLAFGKEIEPKP